MLRIRWLFCLKGWHYWHRSNQCTPLRSANAKSCPSDRMHKKRRNETDSSIFKHCFTSWFAWQQNEFSTLFRCTEKNAPSSDNELTFKVRYHSFVGRACLSFVQREGYFANSMDRRRSFPKNISPPSEKFPVRRRGLPRTVEDILQAVKNFFVQNSLSSELGSIFGKLRWFLDSRGFTLN